MKLFEPWWRPLSLSADARKDLRNKAVLVGSIVFDIFLILLLLDVIFALSFLLLALLVCFVLTLTVPLYTMQSSSANDMTVRICRGWNYYTICVSLNGEKSLYYALSYYRVSFNKKDHVEENIVFQSTTTGTWKLLGDSALTPVVLGCEQIKDDVGIFLSSPHILQEGKFVYNILDRKGISSLKADRMICKDIEISPNDVNKRSPLTEHETEKSVKKPDFLFLTQDGEEYHLYGWYKAQIPSRFYCKELQPDAVYYSYHRKNHFNKIRKFTFFLKRKLNGGYEKRALLCVQ
jgi:hypothetical protein